MPSLLAASEAAEANPQPAAQGLMQRTAGAQVSASRLSRQGDDADVELGFLEEEGESSPGMMGTENSPSRPVSPSSV